MGGERRLGLLGEIWDAVGGGKGLNESCTASESLIDLTARDSHVHKVVA